MAKLEIDIVGNTSGLGKAANEAIGHLGSLEVKYNRLKIAEQAANKSLKDLEDEFASFNKQLYTGSISSDNFAKKTKVVKENIILARNEVEAYRNELTRLSVQMDSSANKSPIYTKPQAAVPIGINIPNTPNLPASSDGFSQLIKGANGAYSIIRKLAYILPGVGIAGIIGFATEPIINYVTALGTVPAVVDKVAKSQDVLTQAMLAGDQSAQADLTNLQLLFRVYQDGNAPLEERKKAYQQIQQLYPDYFANIAFEQRASKTTEDAYNSLTNSILTSARAKAAANQITKNAERQLENETKAIKLRSDIEKQSADVQAKIARKKVVDSSIGAGTSELSGAQAQALDRLNKAQDKLNAKAKELREIKVDNNILDAENVRLSDAAVKNLEAGGSLVDLKTPKIPKAKKEPVNRAPDILTSTFNDVSLGGLTGADKDVETIKIKYAKANKDLLDNAKKSTAGRDTLTRDLATLQKNEALEISRVVISEAQRTSDEVDRINNIAAQKIADNKDKELADINKRYDAEIKKAGDSTTIIAALNDARFREENAVVSKYEAQRLDDQDKLNSKIQDLNDKAFTNNENLSKRVTDQNKDALRQRLSDVSKYFDELRKLNTAGELGGLVLDITEKGVKKNITDKSGQAEKQNAQKTLSDLASGFGSKFFQTLNTINAQADRSFGAIIDTLGSTLGTMLDDVFSKQLSQILKNLIDGAGASTTQAIAAAAGIAGGLVSGITPKTSYAGQAAGGALSGAASGALIGSAIPGLGTLAGGLIGGALGAIGGLFGASKANKEQERLQKQQLEEAKKQTELLRQNASTYTSAITGRMTDQGILTNIDIGAMGELKATVSGKQIDFILARNNNSRG